MSNKLSIFRKYAAGSLGQAGIVSGTDGDFGFVILDANHFDMTVIECQEDGLEDTVSAMPNKPDAIINAQFLKGNINLTSEGQVVREGRLVWNNSQPARYYLAQKEKGSSIQGFVIGKGDPSAQQKDARVSFGGLGPVLVNGKPTALTPWATSIYNKSAGIGRGIIALDRKLGRILLLVQKDGADNGIGLTELQKLLQDMGVSDAVFNDGSDSEALFAQGKWLVDPGLIKEEGMDYAIGFVDRRKFQRVRMLVIDGTKTSDGESFASNIAQPVHSQYAPRNLADDLKQQTSLASIKTTFEDGVLHSWKTGNDSERQRVAKLFRNAGAPGAYADLMYLSGHAWRHGELWYHHQDSASGAVKRVFSPWTDTVAWKNTPQWLILAGCAVLSLRYSRLVSLSASERVHLNTWYREIHGAKAKPQGVEDTNKKIVFCVFHPGWAWYERVLKASGVRGVLGYWHRSPGAKVGDEKIIKSFAKKLQNGKSFLEAWTEANERDWDEAEAPWAAMIRKGCEKDTLATLELRPPSQAGDFLYFDRYQTKKPIRDAYAYANKTNDTEKINKYTFNVQDDYDHVAMDEGEDLDATTGNVLLYDDGVKPT